VSINDTKLPYYTSVPMLGRRHVISFGTPLELIRQVAREYSRVRCILHWARVCKGDDTCLFDCYLWMLQIDYCV